MNAEKHKKYKIMLVAGEASGDAHSAKVVKRLRELAPDADFEFFGATGKQMRAAGVETIVEADNFAIVGVPEIARALPMFLEAFKTLKNAARERKPDAVVLTDFPDFNLKLAKALKKLDLKVIYYISPQLWAWRKYRRRAIAAYVDKMLVILPFEKKWYAEHGIDHVEFVGNPLAGEVSAKLSKTEFCAKHNLDEHKPIVALLAGSRHKEVARILPVLIETAEMMRRKNPELQFVNAMAPTRNSEEVDKAFAEIKSKTDLRANILTVWNETREALNAADVAAVTSGTATLETAIIGTPLAIVYKGSALNYFLLRPLIDVPHFGLVNLIAEKRLAKELIQDDFTPANLSAELFDLLEPARNSAMRGELAEVNKTLGAGGAARRAAAEILKTIES